MLEKIPITFAEEDEWEMPLTYQSAEQNISVEEASSTIKADFPEFEHSPIKVIGQGQNAVAFEVGGAYIFRFPLTPEEKKKAGVQTKISRHLEGKVDVEIPHIEYHGKSRHYVGYRKIEGEVIGRAVLATLTETQKKQLGKDMAHFIQQMHHALPVEVAEEIGYERKPFVDDEVKRKTEEFVIREFQDEHVKIFLLRVLEYVTELEAMPHREFPLHGDLDIGNAILDSDTKRLKGVLDFGNEIGDIHRDFFFSPIKEPLIGKTMIEEYERVSGDTLSEESIHTYVLARELQFLKYKQDRRQKSFEERKSRLVAHIVAGALPGLEQKLEAKYGA